MKNYKVEVFRIPMQGDSLDRINCLKFNNRDSAYEIYKLKKQQYAKSIRNYLIVRSSNYGWFPWKSDWIPQTSHTICNLNKLNSINETELPENPIVKSAIIIDAEALYVSTNFNKEIIK